MTRKLKRSWLATVLCLMILVSVVSPTFAQTPTLTRDEAIELLQTYSIVQGDQFGNLNLDQTITRAELAKIVVVAMGNGNLAPALASAVRFGDSKGHWAAGYIEMAARMNLIKGRTDTEFDPQAPVTYAEALTIILRMVGKEPAGPWDAVRVMQAAADLNIGPKVSLDALAGAPALRGAIFESLGRTIVTIPLTDGKTLGAKHLDSVAPDLQVTVPPSTVSNTITVTGTVKDAYTVTVNGEFASLNGNRFTANVNLTVGENTVEVVAADRVGNQTKQSFNVLRGGDVARITVTGPTSVKAGESVTLSVMPEDISGNVLPASILTATVADGMGNFNTQTSTFSAGSKAGKATITFSSGSISQTFEVNVAGLAADAHSLRIRPATGAPTVGRSFNVQVEVLDNAGNPITYDDGRLVTLSTSTSGVSIANPNVRTSAGVATFTVSSNSEGDAVFLTNSGSLIGASQTVTFATNIRIVLKADPGSSTADGATPVLIRAELQDENGNPLPNTTGEDIYVDIAEASTQSSLSSARLLIRRGLSSSTGNDGYLIPGFETETVRVTGAITSTHTFTVVPVEISLKEIVVGSAAKFEIVGGGGFPQPGASTPVNLTVRLTDKDGNFVSNTDVAFQVKLSSSNGDEVVDGIPTGVDLTLGSTALRPIDGHADGVVARTTNGIARLTLTYIRSGQVSVQLVPVAATENAYDDQGIADRASSSLALSADTRHVMFAGTPVGIKLQVDLPGSKLTSQEFGVLPANGRATASVKAYLVDSAGGWVPNGSGAITLTRSTGNGTRLTGASPDSVTAVVRNGSVEFSLISTTNASSDTWTASSSLAGVTNQPVTIHTYTAVPTKPTIIAVSGEAGDLNRVLANDDYMIIDLDNYTSGFGFVKVYKSTSSTPIYTSGVIDLASTPSVRVPKASLPSADRYYVVVNNGQGDSQQSELWPNDPTQKVVSEKALKINISRVRYDAATRKLTATGNGVSAQGSIDSTLLSIRNPSNGAVEYLPSDICVASNGSFTCTLPYELNTADFNGGVVLDTEPGWYRRVSAGEAALRDETLTDNRLTPMAYVNYATISFGSVTVSGVEHVTATLTLHGVGLDQGRIHLNQVTVGGHRMGTASQVAPTGTSTKVTFNVPNYSNTPSKSESDSIAANIKAMDGATVELAGNTGWLKTSTNDTNGSISNIPVYTSVQVTKIQYVADPDGDRVTTGDGGKILIYGSGFSGARIDPNNLVFTDRRGNEFTALALTGYTPVAVTDNGLIEIVLTETDAAALEGGSYNGNVYLTSVETTPGNSWYVNGGWPGVTLPRYRLSW